MRVQCAVCGQKFNRITARHVKEHGMTLDEYQSKYGPVTPAALVRVLRDTDTAENILASAIRKMSPEELADLQTAARLQVFSQERRGAALFAVFGMLKIRMEHFQKSAELASKIQSKLCDEEWRLERHEDGTPVTTKELIDLGYFAQADMKRTEELLMRLVNMVVQDNKAVVSRPGAADHSAFTGEHDGVTLPDVPSQEREKIRNIFEFVTQLAREEAAKAAKKSPEDEDSDMVIEGEFSVRDGRDGPTNPGPEDSSR